MADPGTRKVQLGPLPSRCDGRRVCGYNPTPEQSPVGDCGKPATLHIALRGDEGAVAACRDHETFALAHLPVLEWHIWGVWCNLPGALWHPSLTPDEADSWCELDGGAQLAGVQYASASA